MSGSTSASAVKSQGVFHAGNGQIIDPQGNLFKARGINLSPSLMGDATQILTDFPGLNFIRLAVTEYEPPETYAAFIKTMTARGIVVELEDHSSSEGTNAGGGRGGAFTGQQLTNELNWYSSVARAYASNPMVWFGSDNEPPINGLSQWERQTYDAIRSTGNNNPIILELPGGGYPDGHSLSGYSMDPAVYTSMSNIIADVHTYGWSSNYVADQSTVTAALTNLVNSGKTMIGADGQVPVILGEYGNSTDGQTIDANADQVIRAAQASTTSGETQGAVAFTWTGSGEDRLTDGSGHLTSFGQAVNQWIASSTGAIAAAAPATAAATTAATTASVAAVPATAAASTASTAVSPTTVSQNTGASTSMSFVGGTITAAGSPSAVYALPAAGDGAITFTQNVLSTGSTLDLRAALARTDWDGAASTLPDYVGVTDTAVSAVVMLATSSGGPQVPIATIDGATNLTLTGLLGHSIT